MAYSLARLKKMKGNRRRVLRMRPIKSSLQGRRELERAGLAIVEFIYSFREELLAAVPDPGAVPEGSFTDAAPDDIDRILSVIVSQMNTVMARLRLRIRGIVEDEENRHRRKWREGVLAATGVDVETVLDPVMGETVGLSVTRSVNLIRDVGDEARKRIGDIVVKGVTQRQHPRELVADIVAAEGMSRRRAINIAADQMNKLNAALDRARQKEAGVDHFTWRHSGKVHARPEHLERDGEIYAWDDNDIDPGDMPGEPPFCGCVAQATLIDAEEGEEDWELETEDAAR
jgi:SPP1 gp7 family putative phage head morphogenesis protein